MGKAPEFVSIVTRECMYLLLRYGAGDGGYDRDWEERTPLCAPLCFFETCWSVLGYSVDIIYCTPTDGPTERRGMCRRCCVRVRRKNTNNFLSEKNEWSSPVCVCCLPNLLCLNTHSRNAIMSAMCDDAADDELTVDGLFLHSLCGAQEATHTYQK